MADYVRQVEELLARARSLPWSATCLALLEEAVRLADLHQDVDLGFQARQPLMFVARDLIRGDIQAAAFAWCLGQYDRDPDRFPFWHQFHQYCSIIGQLANQCDVTRVKLEEMLADFGRRLKLAGYSQRHRHYTELMIAPDLGDRQLAKSAGRAMRNLEPDDLSPGPEWEQALEVETDLFLGRDEQALERAGLFLDDRAFHRGKSDDVCAGLMLPLWRRGATARATALQTRCMRSFEPRRVYYWWFGSMMTFPALTGDLGRAVQRYAECQRAINDHTDPLSRLHFGVDALAVFDQLRAAGLEEIAVRLPKNLPVARKTGRYSVKELRACLVGQTLQLAERFDARNGTTFWHDVRDWQ